MSRLPGTLWWRRRVLPPGPMGLLRRPFIAIAGRIRHPQYRAVRALKKSSRLPRPQRLRHGVGKKRWCIHDNVERDWRPRRGLIRGPRSLSCRARPGGPCTAPASRGGHRRRERPVLGAVVIAWRSRGCCSQACRCRDMAGQDPERRLPVLGDLAGARPSSLTLWRQQSASAADVREVLALGAPAGGPLVYWALCWRSCLQVVGERRSIRLVPATTCTPTCAPSFGLFSGRLAAGAAGDRRRRAAVGGAAVPRLPAVGAGAIAAGLLGAAVLSQRCGQRCTPATRLFGIIEVFLIGLFFSWLLWRTGSLWVAIFCHALYNSLIVLVLRYVPLPA